MSDKQIRPYGTWPSPISSRSLVEKSLRLGNIQIDNENVYWTEGRPEERGRTALMHWSLAEGQKELGPDDINIRSRVHEYGGISFTADAGRIFYIEFSDQQIYELLNDGSIQQITNAESFRYIDIRLDAGRQRLIAVGEDHSDPADIQNLLISINLDGAKQHQVLASGHDFYASPEISPDGSRLCFLTWDHPNMPWDGTQLWMSEIEDSGALTEPVQLAGGLQESIFQPQWSPDGKLYFTSDRSGWWNLYEYAGGKLRCVLEKAAEFGLPQWVFGMSMFSVIDTGKLLASYRDNDGSHLIKIDTTSGDSHEFSLPYTHIDQVRAEGDMASFIGAGPETPAEIVVLNLRSGEWTPIQASAAIEFDKDLISAPEAISFESRPGELVHAWFYPPQNPRYEAPDTEKPPLIVLSHGGPTANSPGVFAMVKQYWTSRGFAVVDVNYSGSTGYGRAYRERLRGTWGIRDVEDCSAAATYLSQQGRVDPERLIIKGGSAGGYTTLAALAFGDVFKAGASYYGVADLELLAGDSHKFESRYLDSMVGPYPEAKDIYFERSPLNHADGIECPVIFLQGLDDLVVPPNQAEVMVKALKDRGIPVAYLPFEGESHGFRQASTIMRSAEAELFFYSRIFGLELEESVEPVEIFNL